MGHTVEQSSCHLKDFASSSPPHHIEKSSNLTDDDVMFSIASVLAGLVEETPFAFSTIALYNMGRYDASHGITSVFCQESFIIPILFNRELRELDGEAFDSVETARPVKKQN